MRVDYLSMDGVGAGVGASQVLPYVVGLARRGVEVHLCTFELHDPTPELRRRLAAEGVTWTPLAFGRAGAPGGVARVLKGARWARGRKLVHARSDLAAAAAIAGGADHFVWDVRSLWADQRIALGMLREGSTQERVLRRIEHAAARRAARVVTLTDAVVDVLEDRHGIALRERTVVIPTCVDLDLFAMAPMPTGQVRLGLSGTMNAYYDVPAMLTLSRMLSTQAGATLVAMVPPGSPWESQLAVAGERLHLRYEDMPGAVVGCHVGLSVCRLDAGVSLAAAMPTKIAEFLASGRPVVVNRGLGDMDDIIQRFNCGVSLPSVDKTSLAHAVQQIMDLLADPETPQRCRQAAMHHFSLDTALDGLMHSYSAVPYGSK